MTKIWGGQYTYEQLINTDKALQVIIAIFLSVAIAFCLRFGGDVAHAYHIHFQLQKNT